VHQARLSVRYSGVTRSLLMTWRLCLAKGWGESRPS
jgi:hypothetical protein